MIEPEDRVELAPGVVVDEDGVVDLVRRATVRANATALLLLAHANGCTIAQLGELLERAGADDGVRDARTFCAQLNRQLLVNVRMRRGEPLRRRLAAARFGVRLRAPRRRVDGRSTLKVMRALAPVGAALTLVTLPLAVLAGAWTLALAVGAGVVLHELAHAVALHGIPRALVLDGLRPSVLHPRLGSARTTVAAVAGPLVPSLTALGVIVLARSAALSCVPLAAHALGLTVLAPDGRNACGLS